MRHAFVCGYSRSGTTLLATILDSHPRISMGYELVPTGLPPLPAAAGAPAPGPGRATTDPAAVLRRDPATADLGALRHPRRLGAGRAGGTGRPARSRRRPRGAPTPPAPDGPPAWPWRSSSASGRRRAPTSPVSRCRPLASGSSTASSPTAPSSPSCATPATWWPPSRAAASSGRWSAWPATGATTTSASPASLASIPAAPWWCATRTWSPTPSRSTPASSACSDSHYGDEVRHYWESKASVHHTRHNNAPAVGRQPFTSSVSRWRQDLQPADVATVERVCGRRHGPLRLPAGLTTGPPQARSPRFSTPRSQRPRRPR